jgi:hypothetical protein
MLEARESRTANWNPVGRYARAVKEATAWAFNAPRDDLAGIQSLASANPRSPRDKATGGCRNPFFFVFDNRVPALTVTPC